MSQIVDTVLSVEESSRAKALYQPMTLDLGPWLEHHQTLWEKTLGRPAVLNIPGQPLPTVYVDEKLLFRLIDNLVRNVRKHTPVGSPCFMTLENTAEGLMLSIEDQGPHLSQALVDSMNDPSLALETAGVGLHLCHSIAELCSIKLNFAKRAGGGLRVTLLFRGRS